MRNLKQWERKHRTNHHHLTPRSRGGSSLNSNLLTIDMERHNAWHFLFGNKTLQEIIDLLERLKQIKKGGRVKYY